MGRWSPVTDYAVFIEATELVPFEDSLPSATDDAAVRALPHKVAACTRMLHVLHAHINTCVFSTVASQVAYRQTNLDLTGLVPSTEYTAMVLPRNGKGWGSRWSEPLRATTEPAVLPHCEPAVNCRHLFAQHVLRVELAFLLQLLCTRTSDQIPPKAA